MFSGTSSSRSFPLANGASWFRVHSLRAMGKGPYLIFQPPTHGRVCFNFGGSESLQKVNWLPGCSRPNFFWPNMHFDVRWWCRFLSHNMWNCGLVNGFSPREHYKGLRMLADIDHHPMFQHFGTTNQFTNDKIIPFLALYLEFGWFHTTDDRPCGSSGWGTRGTRSPDRWAAANLRQVLLKLLDLRGIQLDPTGRGSEAMEV